MELFLTLEQAGSGQRTDLLVEAAPDATVADLQLVAADPALLAPGAAGNAGTAASAAARVLATSRAMSQPSLAGVISLDAQRDRRRADPEPSVPAPRGEGLWRGNRRLDPGERLADAGIVDGTVLGLGGPVGFETQEPVGLVDLRVVGGPGAGVVHRLGPGEYSVGSSSRAALVVDDPAMDDVALVLRVTADGHVTVEDDDDESGWETGSPRTVADSVLSLETPRLPDASLNRDDDGGLAYNRPPRLMPADPGVTLARPTEPGEQDKPPFPWVTILIPLGLALVMFLTLGKGQQPTYLLFGLMSPAMMLANVVSGRRAGKKKSKTQGKEHAAALTEFEESLARSLREEEEARRVASPDPAEALLIAVGPRRRLWERRDDDPDALALRVGTSTLPARVTVPEEHPTVTDVPVVLPLAALGVAGIAGPVEARAPLARWLVAQAAVLHSPQELSIVVLSGCRDAADSEPMWGWTRWLPHLRPQSGEACVALLGTDLDSSARRVGELASIVERRRAAIERQRGARAGMTPVLVVLDGARELRRLPGMPTVLDDGPAVGVVALALEDDERALPEECRAVVTADPADPARIDVAVTGAAPVTSVLADAVSDDWATRVGRALAPVRDVSRDAESAGIPGSARLLDLLGMNSPTSTDVERRWAAGGRSTTALLGVAADGPLALDMRTDGPHALVAGTTGAGKSELLQTLIASLAVANRPDEMSFVLVDYKGGAAFKDCAGLPHTVGMVTDLDAHLTARALESLSAELKRREEQLAEAGAKDIEDYLAAARPDDPAMPRLTIVIDEFASLKAELPEFVTGLVAIAQRGRSLGVHLVLATQRPAGVVSADIKANTNLRIALRVTDDADSLDVIDSAVAATIARATPGRAYARTGHGSLTAFQSARVGGRAPGASGGTSVSLTPVPWSSLGAPLERVAGADADQVEEATDLSMLVGAISQAATTAAIATPPSPWLPAVPELVTVEDLPATRPLNPVIDEPGTVPPIPFGLMDLPALQQQAAFALDLQRGGHLAIIGTQRTGRSSALRTIAAQIAATTSSRDVHLYALDFGNNALLPLSALPHCGAVVPRDQVERAERLLGLLAREVTRRQVQLAADGVADIVEQRATAAPEDRLPYLVLLLDRWEGFTATFDEVDAGRIVQAATRLLSEGGAVGLRVVVSGDRTLLSGRTSTVLDHRLVMRLADRNEYGFAGINARDLPDQMPPGRGFRPDDMTEVQIALLDADPSGAAQVHRLQEIGRAAADRDADLEARFRPTRVDPLPVSITVDEALALGPRPKGRSHVLVGVGGDTLSPRWFDLSTDGPGVFVGGPMRSGRSTTLVTMTRSLLEQGWSAIIVTPRRSPLRSLSLVPGVVDVLDGDATGPAFTDAVAKAKRPLVVVIDDLELVPLDGPLSTALMDHLGSIRDTGEAIVAAGTTTDVMGAYRGLPKEVRRSRSGLLLTPQSYTEGETFGLRLPRSTGGPAPEGRGLLVVGGIAEPVQVALP